MLMETKKEKKSLRTLNSIKINNSDKTPIKNID